MEIFYFILLLLWSLAMICTAWYGRCSTKTYNQRIAMINWLRTFINNTPRFYELHKAFEKVSYVKHHWTLIKFQDPMKLYAFHDEYKEYLNNQ